jgi:hypothetical protein
MRLAKSTPEDKPKFKPGPPTVMPRTESVEITFSPGFEKRLETLLRFIDAMERLEKLQAAGKLDKLMTIFKDD